MIIQVQAHSRAGLIGNPSDGHHGKTISIIVRNFAASVVCCESPRPAIAGRNVFTADIFDCRQDTVAGVGDEFQLTDAINRLAQQQAMYALAWQARGYDIGNRIEYAKCSLDFALRRPDTGPEPRSHPRSLLEAC
jgi:UTP-glucose-1-phosphate uridylyltransferase